MVPPMTTADARSPKEVPPLESWPERGMHELLGIEAFTLDEEGEARATLELGEQHTNPSGLVHGGAIFTLIDSTIAAAVLRTLDDDERMATQSSTIDFLRPAKGKVTARARVDRRGTMTAYAAGEAIDEEGRVVAKTSAVWAIRKDPPS